MEGKDSLHMPSETASMVSRINAVGIVAEYNPFHNGHAYHLKKAKELSGADYAVVVMSPDFVQRGEPAITDKYTRTKTALLGGADLVLELPVCFATGSAEFFARGAVRILDLLGCVSALSFGCETASLPLLDRIASITAAEPEAYTCALKEALRSGKSFPAAREEAVFAALAGENTPSAEASVPPALSREHMPAKETSLQTEAPEGAGHCSRERIREVLSLPNNILAVEYLKALKIRGSAIRPVPVPRVGGGYHETSPGESIYTSATALRGLIRQEITENNLASYIPGSALSPLLESLSGRGLWSETILDRLIRYRWSMETNPEIYLDLDHELACRMGKIRPDLAVMKDGLAALAEALASKQRTLGRIRRALLHMLLNIRDEDAACLHSDDSLAYARVLGFRKSAAPLLHHIKSTARLPLITKNADAARILGRPALDSFSSDLHSSQIYQLLFEKQPADPKNEYQRSPVIL